MLGKKICYNIYEKLTLENYCAERIVASDTLFKTCYFQSVCRVIVYNNKIDLLENPLLTKF